MQKKAPLHDDVGPAASFQSLLEDDFDEFEDEEVDEEEEVDESLIVSGDVQCCSCHA